MSAIEISSAIKDRILRDVGPFFCLFDKIITRDDMVFDYASFNEGIIKAEFYVKPIQKLNKIHFVEALDFLEMDSKAEFKMLKKKNNENVRFFYNNRKVD